MDIRFARKGVRDLPRETALALLEECFQMLAKDAIDAIHVSVNGTNDLFDQSGDVSAQEILEFRAGRVLWLAEFERTLHARYRERVGGARRPARRPDAGDGGAAVQVLECSEQDEQVSLLGAVRALRTLTREEIAALSPRVALLLAEDPAPDFDNPLSPEYFLDAVGVVARSIFPGPRIWRTLMVRIIGDVAPVLNKIYIRQNRFLGDRNIVPNIKACLRSRSRHRPRDDGELLSTFRRFRSALAAKQKEVPPIRVRRFQLVGGSGGQMRETAARPTPMRRVVVGAAPRERVEAQPSAVVLEPATIHQALAKLIAPESIAAANGNEGNTPTDRETNLPSSDELMVRGVTREMMAVMGHLQTLDLPEAIAAAVVPPEAAPPFETLVTSNLIPHIRAVLGPRIGRHENVAAADFVGMMFDYVFRDSLVPEGLHRTFERLQVPVLKSVLLDNSFFADREHPARIVLELLADSTIAAADDPDYFGELQGVASEVAHHLCAHRSLDFAAFERAGALLDRFAMEDHRRASSALASMVADAEATETRELARSRARQLVRGSIAGLDLPRPIRSFVETVWVDYLAGLLREGESSALSQATALQTLADLCWTVSFGKRPGDRARLRALIPSLVTQLRQGCLAVQVPIERINAFLGTLFDLHIAAINSTAPPPVTRESSGAAKAWEGPSSPESQTSDYVAEMIMGTWLEFKAGADPLHLQLWWASPLRSRYVFRGRDRKLKWVMTPEDIVNAIETGKASIFAEPVPLFDRAADAVFDALGGKGSTVVRYTKIGAEAAPSSDWTLK
jgi:hypothetical protein